VRTVLHRLDVTLSLIAIRDGLTTGCVQGLERDLQPSTVLSRHGPFAFDRRRQGWNDGLELVPGVLQLLSPLQGGLAIGLALRELTPRVLNFVRGGGTRDLKRCARLVEGTALLV
jgi:hypothetical protein